MRCHSKSPLPRSRRKNPNAQGARQGQAVLYTVPPNLTHVEEYRQAQQEATAAGRGVWDREKPMDVHPDYYRKLKKGREC
jgi:endonuclease YncB( thermonuclease family)